MTVVNNKGPLSNTRCTKCGMGILRFWGVEKEGSLVRKIYKCSNVRCFTKTVVESVLEKRDV